jgi:23S rRNA (uridine2552-2'-O)-methyltransferase
VSSPYDNQQVSDGIDLLLSDMAPNLNGMDAIDAPRSLYRAELALDRARETLKPGGHALMKVLLP